MDLLFLLQSSFTTTLLLELNYNCKIMNSLLVCTETKNQKKYVSTIILREKEIEKKKRERVRERII